VHVWVHVWVHVLWVWVWAAGGQEQASFLCCGNLYYWNGHGHGHWRLAHVTPRLLRAHAQAQALMRSSISIWLNYLGSVCIQHETRGASRFRQHGTIKHQDASSTRSRRFTTGATAPGSASTEFPSCRICAARTSGPLTPEVIPGPHSAPLRNQRIQP
jgi:hypothetical protein